MTRVSFGFVVAIGAMVVAPAVARAQAPARPYRGLFGGGVGNTTQSLTLNITFAGGRDTNFLSAVTVPDLTFAGVPPESTTSTFAEASGTLAYNFSRKRLGFSASGTASTLYYRVLESPFIPTYSAGASAWYDFGKAGRVNAGYGFTYSPFYFFNALPTLGGLDVSLPVLPDQTAGTFIENSITNSASAGYGLSLTKRWSLGTTYGYSNQFSNSHSHDLRSQTGGVTTAYQLTKHLGAHFGISRSFYTSSFTGLETHTVGNQINAGARLLSQPLAHAQDDVRLFDRFRRIQRRQPDHLQPGR